MKLKVKLAGKLMGGFVVVLLLTGVVGVAGLVLAGNANQDSEAIFTDEVRGLVVVGDVITAANEVRRAGLLHVIEANEDTRSSLENQIAELDRDVQELFDDLEGFWAGQPTKLRLLEDLRDDWEAYAAARDGVLELSRSGNEAEARALTTGEVHDLFQQVGDDLDQVAAANETQAQTRLDRASAAFNSGRNTVVGVIVLAVLVGFTTAVMLSRRIARNVGSVANAAQRLADGDLSSRAEVHSGDEVEALSEGFNAMARKLQETVEAERDVKQALQKAVDDYSEFASKVALGDLTVRLSPDGDGDLSTLSDNLNGMVIGLGELSGQVRESSRSIASAAAEILAAVSQHTAGATQQSAAINETSTTVDEIRAAAEQVAGKARDVADLSESSAQASEVGRDSVDAITEGMRDIRGRVEAIAQDILALSEQTQQIGQITATVDDLADQSNLLALNATIEAAKAGEHGRGFAVVADEVRNLADQSKQASSRVRSLLGDIQKATDAAVMATEQGTNVVDAGMTLAQRAGDVIGELSSVVSGATQAAQQIRASAHEQSVGMDQIAHAMTDISQATTQFVTGAQQSQQAAEELNSLAQQLQVLTEKYGIEA
jgi:methyl-accepting chemotaxis protein